MNNYEQVEIAAVCQCSGNSRGLFEPRVMGGEWANGAMGNAMWKGVRLRDILNKAGLQKGALQVRLNGQALPLLNGFPVRLAVPGWYATYWTKTLADIEVIGSVDNNVWMNPAYRIPANDCACVEPGKSVKTVPINRMDVRSFIACVVDGAQLRAGQEVEVKGIAFDGGYGIRRVLFSADGGKSWNPAGYMRNVVETVRVQAV